MGPEIQIVGTAVMSRVPLLEWGNLNFGNCSANLTIGYFEGKNARTKYRTIQGLETSTALFATKPGAVQRATNLPHERPP